MKSNIAAWMCGLLLTSSALAETKVLTVGKMDCQDCAEAVKEKLCGIAQFQTCDVKIIDLKKEIGQVTLVTKGNEKIDMKKVAEIIADEGYDLKK